MQWNDLQLIKYDACTCIDSVVVLIGMMAPLFSLAVLLCLPWMVLGQEDCLTTQGQKAWAISNLDLADCAAPFQVLNDSQKNPQLKDASKIQSVS